MAARPDSRFLIPVFARRGSPGPAGRLCGTNHAHVYAPYPPRHPLCHRSALRAPHSTVTFERRLITRASEISWAVGGMVEPEQCAADLNSGQAVSHSRGRLVPGFERHAGVRCSLAPACGDPASGRWCCSAMLTAARLLFCCGECCLIGSPSPRARCECTRQLGSSAAVWV